MPVPILDGQILSHRAWMEWQSNVYWCAKLRRFTAWMKHARSLWRCSFVGTFLEFGLLFLWVGVAAPRFRYGRKRVVRVLLKTEIPGASPKQRFGLNISLPPTSNHA